MANEPNPHEALASIQAARGAIGRDLDYPVGWDVLYGLVVAVMVMGQGLAAPWSLFVLAGSLAALALMVRWWRARVGWWVNGYGPPRARWVAIGLAAVLIGLMGLSLWPRMGDGPWWAPLLAGVLAWIAAGVGGRIWMRVFRTDLERAG